jgi:hypothetical protein
LYRRTAFTEPSEAPGIADLGIVLPAAKSVGFEITALAVLLYWDARVMRRAAMRAVAAEEIMVFFDEEMRRTSSTTRYEVITSLLQDPCDVFCSNVWIWVFWKARGPST